MVTTAAGPRGFFAVGIWHPKREVNVGSVLRMAHLYGAAFTFTVGHRYGDRQRSDTTHSRLSVPLMHFDTVDSLCRHLPYGAPLVAAELDARAVALTAFEHPASACYLFGAEDHGLPSDVLDRCHHVVQIPAPLPWSMNVAQAAAIVIHDRYSKVQRVARG